MCDANDKMIVRGLSVALARYDIALMIAVPFLLLHITQLFVLIQSKTNHTSFNDNFIIFYQS